MFDRVTQPKLDAKLNSMGRFVDQQNKVYQAQTSDAVLKGEADTASLKYNDEAAFGTAIGNARAEIDRYGEANGQSLETRQARFSQLLSATQGQRVQRMALDDPLAAQRYYTDNQADVDATMKPQFEHMLKSAVLPVQLHNLVQSVMCE